MQKLHLTYNYFFGRWEWLYIPKKMSVISRSSHWKFTFSIDKLCRFFFLRSFLQWRILKNWMQSTMQNHRKEKCWHNKEMGLELKMLSSIQRKCHEMNFKRNDNFLACLHTMPFWWNLRHLSSYKKVKISCLHNFTFLKKNKINTWKMAHFVCKYPSVLSTIKRVAPSELHLHKVLNYWPHSWML